MSSESNAEGLDKAWAKHCGISLDTASDVEANDDGSLSLEDVSTSILETPAEGPPMKRRRGRPKKQVSRSEPHVDSAPRDLAVGEELAVQHFAGVHHIPIGHFGFTSIISAGEKGTHVELSSPGQECALFRPELVSNLCAAFRSAVWQKDGLDQITINLAKHYMDPQFHLASLATMESQFGVPYKTLQDRTAKLASSSAIFQRFFRQHMEKSLSSLPSKCLLAYYDVYTYDETPMMVALQHTLPLDDVEPSQFSAVELQDSLYQSQQAQHTLSKLRTKGKLMQLQSQYGFLVCAGEIPYLLFGSTYHPLAALERTTSEVVYECLRRSDAVTRASERFQHRLRSTCVDKAKTNPLAEHNVPAARQTSFEEVLLPCDTHCIATSFKRTLEDLMPDDVSGLINLAVAVQESGKFAVFRSSLIHVIRQKKILVVAGTLSNDAKAYKSRLLETCIGRGNRALAKACLLELCCSGDWRNRNCIEVLVQLGHPIPNLELTRKEIEIGLLDVLLSSAPRVFPRSRWTGSEEAITAVLLLYGVHFLLEDVWAHFLSMVEKGGGGVSYAAPQDDLEAGQTNYDILQLVSASGLDGSAAQNINKGQTMAELNAKVRRAAQGWIQSKPFPRLLLMKEVVVPLTDLMRQQLYHSSWEFEKCQRAQLAKLLLSGQTPKADDRSYQLHIAAAMTQEVEFMNKLRSLLTSTEPWSIFPPECMTVQFNALCHRVLSRSGSAVYELLQRPHRKFPICLFGIPHNQACAQALYEVPLCVKDSWSKHLQSCYASYTDPSCLAVLESHMQLQKTDIAGVEARHASVRRHLEHKSLQTHTLDLAACSSSWLLQNHRRFHAKRKCVAGNVTAPAKDWNEVTMTQKHPNPNVLFIVHRETVKSKRCGSLHVLSSMAVTENLAPDSHCLKFVQCFDQQQNPRCFEILASLRDVSGVKTDSKSISGGAWRAFERLHASGPGGLPNLSDLSSRYRAMKDANGDEWEQIKTLGIAAKVNAQAGGQGFGVSAYQARRDRARALLQRVTSQVDESTSDLAKQCEVLLKHAAAEQRGATFVVRLANCVAKRQSETKNVAAKSVDETLAQYKQNIGDAMVKKMTEVIPEISGHLFMAVPSGRVQCFEVEDKSMAASIAATAWMSQHKSVVGKQLTNSWTSQHKLLSASECGQLKHKREKHTICQEANLCLCSGKGLLLKKFYAKIIECMKKQFPTPDEKKILAKGHIVMQLTSSAQLILPKTDAELQAFNMENCFLAISLIELSSCRGQRFRQHSTHVATCNFMTAHECLVPLLNREQLLQSWFLRWWHLEETSRPLAELCPRVVSIQATTTTATQVWPIQSKTRVRKKTASDAVVAFDVTPGLVEMSDDDFALGDVCDPDLQEMLLGLEDAEETNVEKDTTGDMGDIDAAFEALWEEYETSKQHVPDLPKPRLYTGREQAAAVVSFGALGRLSYYHSKAGYEAICSQHTTCTQSRSALAGARTNGRPLGFMTSWLQLQCSASEHKSKEFLTQNLSLVVRSTARDDLRHMEGGLELLSFERELYEGESPEPERLKGIL
eukprot:1622490-Amphidinium_carterae.5